MLKIRLARTGRSKRPFYKIVVTEHSKPANTGFKSVLGWYNPMEHKVEADLEKAKKHINNGAKPSERVAKILYNVSNDEFFAKFFSYKERKRTKKNEDK
ncbi:30S ribosomal protein S16 [Candidatus Absconditicoccus praedator]|uniref:30S ribosomal protein S16 n=1 Tax=Candidatus Absconditicoccus praedator TaxID=2735562 RepID=UPI001E5A9CAE|nr:30S ribosomal protein S16 [Candidatus Absconditicoccus praedator]UFX83089.1 30S ribosomal protein S16 [Candidatus Absconditicoccus praedator]